MQHPARTGNTEVCLKVSVMIPGERAHPVTTLKSGFLQRFGEQARATVKIGVSVRMQRLVRHPRNDLDPAEESSGMFKNAWQD
jgi:hypothetical protein